MMASLSTKWLTTALLAAKFAAGEVPSTSFETLADRHPDFLDIINGEDGGYETVLTLELPYADISIPMKFVVDCAQQREQIDYYQGLETDYFDKSGKYKYVFKNNERACLHNEPPHQGPAQLVHPFPLDLKTYKHEGSVIFHGIKVEKYSTMAPHGTTHTMDDQLVFYYDNLLHRPVGWHMHSRNKIFDSHTDEYVVRYMSFTKLSSPHVGALPDACTKAATAERNKPAQVWSFPLQWIFSSRTAGAPAVLADTANSGRGISAEFSAFAMKHGLSYESEQEWSRRDAIFRANVAQVNRLNADHEGQAKFKLNKFAAMTVEEVMSFRGGHRKGEQETLKATTLATKEELAALPAAPEKDENFDWRIHLPGSLSPVKDQGICGSCWAFSLISAVESANFLKTKQLVSLPEQFVIDCTWTPELAACDGGESNLGALEIIKRFGGEVPSTDSYGQYLTVDGYCHKENLKTGALLSSWVSLPARDDEAVMRALLQQPLSVAFNVGAATLYYDAGILNVAECEKNTSDDLNHAINLVGFGTCKKTGLKYWTLRNSWSTYWGEKGYFRVVRGKRDCGVTTDAGYPVVQGVHLQPAPEHRGENAVLTKEIYV
ncbi:unnamed protein product [Amoebophrya sp. A120]|nr:unnamed protein product [Amoebophrya sp. A120]|eukprot:GSA120T00002402001.1